MNGANARAELSSPQTSFGQSKNRFRLLFFVVLSVAMCLAALANVASASAASSAEDQYLEQVPNGGGQSGGTNNNSNFVQTVGGSNGNVTEADVKKAAEKNKRNSAENGDGSTGSTGAAGGGTNGQPPTAGSAVGSAATAAKFGPFSRTTFFLIIGLTLALGGVARLRGGAFTARGSADGTSTAS